MGLVSKAVPHIAGGVSQQPDTLRHWSQLEVQENAISSLINGVYKRPPSVHIAKLRNGGVNDAFIHTINRSATEKYVVVITNGDLEVWDTNGNAKTVNFPNGKGYLTATTPRDMFHMVTVDDLSILVNTTIIPAMAAGTTGGTFKGTKQEFSALPTTGQVSGDIWAISGNPQTIWDDYYVKWDGVVWRECPINAITYTFDATKMPWKLVKNGDGTFTFDKVVWNDRVVGNAVTSPVPSFIGKSIKDVFYYKNRLGFIAGEGVILSRFGDFFNFWRSTVTAVRDTDPIDAQVSHNKVSVLHNAIPFNNSLVLLSDLTQFLLTSDGPLTPKTIAITPISDYETSFSSKAVASGSSIYLPVERSNHFSLREFYVDNNSATYQADNITAHVPQYITNNVFKMAAYAQEDYVFCINLTDRNKIFVYKSHWGDNPTDTTSDVGSQKLQSAWSVWTFALTDVILNIDIVGTYLYVVVDRSDGIFLERIDLQYGITDVNLPIQVHLDRKQVLNGVYDPDNNWTTWTLGFNDADGDYEVILASHFTGQIGQTLTTTRPAADTIRAVGDYSPADCFVGRNYNARVQLSKIYVRDRENTALAHSVLKLRQMRVFYFKTGRFIVTVTPQYRDAAIYTFTGRRVGVGNNLIGSIPLESGIFQFPILSDGQTVDIDISSTSYLPMHLQSLEWEGVFTTKAKRI